MAWIEAHQSLAANPKLYKLMNLTGYPRDKAVGKLTILWLWVLEYAEDGDLSNQAKFSPNELGLAVDIKDPEESKRFYDALLDANFIERETLLVHDWLEYAGFYLIKRYSGKQRAHLRAIWAKHGYAYGKGQGKGRKVKLKKGDKKESTRRHITLTNTITNKEEGEEGVGAAPSNGSGSKSPGDPPSSDPPPIPPKKPKTDEEYFALVRDQIPLQMKERGPLWREAFPDVDIDTEGKAALSWLLTHPKAKDRRSDFPRFLNGWFNRAQKEFRGQHGRDRPPPPRAGPPQIGKSSNLEEALRRTAEWVPPEERKKS